MTGAITAAGIGLIGTGVSAGMSGAASGSAANASKKALEWQKNVYNEAVNRSQPYLNLGAKGARLYRQNMPKLADTAQYEQYLQPYTMEQYKESPLYTPMVTNLAELQATPGYQFELGQGLQALGQTAASRGGLLSGAQQKAAMKYGQGVASTGFQKAWERAQNAYRTAFTNNLAQQGQYMTGRLKANAQAADIYGNAAQMGATTNLGLGNIGQATGANIGQTYENLGTNQAMGSLGTGAAINKGLSGLGSAAGDIYNVGKDQGWWGAGSNNLSTLESIGNYGTPGTFAGVGGIS